MSLQTIRTVIIDDDTDWLDLMSIRVNAHPNLELLGAFTSPIAAHSLVTEGGVDLLFLDVEMPEMNGLDFMRHLMHPPLVIFITSHRNFAVESYEMNAVDYLVKPFTTPRFLQAVEKVSIKLTEKQAAPKDDDSFFFIRENNQFVKIELNNILFLKSLQNYTQIITTTQTHLTLMSLSDIEGSLPNTHFLRVHRSYIVNTSKITSINKSELYINDNSIPIARNLSEQVIKTLVKSRLVTKGPHL